MDISQLKDDFMLEAVELLDEAEEALLAIDSGESFTDCYNKFFRSFHSLKGASGMFGLDELQVHMHQLESLLEQVNDSLSKVSIDYFLRGVDCAREYFSSDKIEFQYMTSLDFDQNTTLEQNDHLEESKKEESTQAQAISEHQSITRILDEKVRNQASKDKELIYLVDDEKLILEILEELLIEAGYRVRTFDNGQSLLDIIEDKEPDLIVSDINMPKLDGITMNKKLRKLGVEVPIIFVSAHVTKDAILSGLKSNASFFIEKPFDEKNLLTVVGSVLNTARVKKALAHSMDYVLYQFANHEELLKEAGREKELSVMKNEILNLLNLNKSL